MSAALVVVGDALLDRDVVGRAVRLCPDAPVPVVDEEISLARPGGAALAAALAAGADLPVVLVTALGDDPAGAEVASRLEGLGVTVVDAGLDGPTPEKIRVRSGDRSLLRVDRGGPPGPVGALPPAGAEAVAGAAAVLVSDYGRGMAAAPQVRAALAATRAPVVWDPHPRGPEPVAGARLVTPNRSELLGRVGAEGPSPVPRGRAMAGELGAVAAAAMAARRRWRAHAVAVTMGAGGALLVADDGPPLAVPAPRAAGGDPCGAGDHFAASVASALARGRLPSEAVIEAVASASAFVAAGGAGAAARGWQSPGVPSPAARRSTAGGDKGGWARRAGAGGDGVGVGRALAEAAATRQRGGTVVATGGCFDVLHAGHLQLLKAARALGDCLIVCVNSDASVRRLKGPARPVVPEADRLAMLAALSCVDAAVAFDDDTPVPLLRRLRPDVFAKGGDYAGRRVPEADVLAEWGGQAVVVPYLDGRSTTGVLRQREASAP